MLILIFSALMIISGALISIFSKIMYQTSAINIHGKEVLFEKPWFQDWAMFVGEIIVFFPEFVRYSYVKLQKKNIKYADLINNNKDEVSSPKKRDWTWLKITIPAACDSFATILMNVALIWISVSIWQMLRGSIIIFSAILTVIYRRRKLYRYEVIGMILVVSAIVILGAVAMINNYNAGETDAGRPAWQIILAVILIIVAQGVQAAQTIIEEVFLHDSTYPPMLLVAFEGMWGFIFCTFVFMPIAQFIPGEDGNGLHEDSIDSFVMLGNNLVLLLWTSLYVIAITFYNIFSMYIIDITNALTRNIIDPMRTMLLWVISLFIFYVIARKYGEEWNGWSVLELGGFAVMTVGILLYNGVIKINFLMGSRWIEEQKIKKSRIQEMEDQNEKEKLLNIEEYENGNEETSNGNANI